VKVSTDLDRRFRERAAADGSLDVAYDLVDSPIGTLLVAATGLGLCRIEFDPEPERDLDEYFEGRRERFELPVDVRFESFRLRVMDELNRVPYGQVTTYGALAARAGRPTAARAVGTFMNRNPIPIVLPCHRVVGANGSLVGYGGGLARKERLLQLEGASLTLPG
jgi:methylated-DNA-[protein]-cysteine S-methyltransferase